MACRYLQVKKIDFWREKSNSLSLQISGPGCLQNVQEISETVRKSTGCHRDMIYCSGSSEEAQKDINNLFQFVEMQLGF